LPSLGRARELARRTTCLSNIKAIATQALTYAGSNRDSLPVAKHDPGSTVQGKFATSVGYNSTQNDRENTEDANSARVSNTRGWFKLLMGGARAYLQPQQFICKSTKTLKHDFNGTPTYYVNGAQEQPWYDFDGYRTADRDEASDSGPAPDEMVSFSYSFFCNLKYRNNSLNSIVGIKLNNRMDPGIPLVADRNPYSNEIAGRKSSSTQRLGVVRYAPGESVLGFPAPLGDYSSASAAGDPGDILRKNKAANSRNHNREGQNVGYLDGHAKWSRHPKAGVDGDSIWSNWEADTGESAGFKIWIDDQGEAPTYQAFPVDAVPPSGRNYTNMRARSTWLTDAVLFP